MSKDPIDPEKLANDWLTGHLSIEDIYEYLDNNCPTEDFSTCELNHVAQCCYHIYLWHIGKLPDPGHFLAAVLKNDLFKAINRADDTNVKALKLYVMFLYNVAPGTWWAKAEAEL